LIDLSIIILNFRTLELTQNCVRSVRLALSNFKGSYEVIVVDNASGDGSYEALQVLEDQNCSVFLSPKNGGFAYGNNFAAARAKGEYLFFLNSDTILYSEVLPSMLRCMQEDPSIGAMSCLMEDGEGVPLVTGHAFENFRTLFLQSIVKPLLPEPLYHLYRRKKTTVHLENATKEADWVSGAALLMKRSLFEKIGGWNENFFMYMEDEELCWCIRKEGFSCEVYSALGLKHLVGKSGGSRKVILERYKSGILYFQIMDKKPMWFLKILLLLQAKRDLKKTETADLSQTLNELWRYKTDEKAKVLRHNSFI